MTTTILTRVHSLADHPPPIGACKAVATIARKLATTDDPAAKAHAITGVLVKFEPKAQDAIVRAVEALHATI